MCGHFTFFVLACIICFIYDIYHETNITQHKHVPTKECNSYPYAESLLLGNKTIYLKIIEKPLIIFGS